jgi:hypothetical protein
LTWRRAAGGYRWVEAAGSWLLVERAGGEWTFELDPEQVLADWIRLSRLAEVQRPTGLRRHLLGFAEAYGWLGVRPMVTIVGVGEPFPAWVEELHVTARWWRASQLIAHCTLRASAGRSLDAGVVALVRAQFGLPPGLADAAVVEQARAGLTAEMADAAGAWSRGGRALIALLRSWLADRLGGAIAPSAE